ncbi:YraN family protein [bacterium]|nr:YraN family protein [bacterium]
MRHIKQQELNINYIKPNDSSRKGDLAEYYAVTWLWDNGYEVFKNTGCTGPIDMIAMKNGETTFVDVKTAQPQQHKRTGNKVTKCQSRNEIQKQLGVQLLQFNPVTRKLAWINHRQKT